MYKDKLYEIMKEYRSYTMDKRKQMVLELIELSEQFNKDDEFAYMVMSMVVDYLYHPSVDYSNEATCFLCVTKCPAKSPELIKQGIIKNKTELFELSFAYSQKVLRKLNE